MCLSLSPSSSLSLPLSIVLHLCVHVTLSEQLNCHVSLAPGQGNYAVGQQKRENLVSTADDVCGRIPLPRLSPPLSLLLLLLLKMLLAYHDPLAVNSCGVANCQSKTLSSLWSYARIPSPHNHLPWQMPMMARMLKVHVV